MTLKPTDNTQTPKKKIEKDKTKDKPKNEEASKAQNRPGQSKHHSDISPTAHTSPPEIIATRSQTRIKACRRLGMVPALPVSSSAPFLPVSSSSHYPPCNRNFSYPVTMDDWNTLITNAQYPRMPNCHYSMPYQQMHMFNPIPVLASPICPYSTALLTPPMLGSIVPPQPPMPVKKLPMPCGYKNIHYSPEQIVPSKKVAGKTQTPTKPNVSPDETMYDVPTQTLQELQKDGIDFFLTLPKNLFPTARMLQLDPNPIIDELCKLPSVHTNLPWMLDLEFGLPKVPITRPIPIYDVKFNSIRCKNTPTAIHPGFESCNEDFKRVVLFYYDCVISTWYRGYVFLNSDHSVENFQSWLLLAMQMFGMCWP